MRKPRPENFPPPTADEAPPKAKPEPVAPTVEVSPALAREPVKEQFSNGDDIWGDDEEAEPESDGSGDEPKPKKKLKFSFKAGSVKEALIVYPIKKIHDQAANATGYEGWRVTAEEEQYWNYLAGFAIENFPIEYLAPLVMLMGLAVIESTKFIGFNQWRKDHPPNSSHSSPETPADTGPAEPSGPTLGARGVPPGAMRN
jgi:hypothetical protein